MDLSTKIKLAQLVCDFSCFVHFEKVRDLHGKQWVPSRFEIKSSRRRFLSSLL